MLDRISVFFQHSFFYNKRNLLIIWILAGIVTGMKQYYLGEINSHINNFVIFKTSFPHLLSHQNMYLEYPKEYFDLYLYGPIFSVLIAPFAMMPTVMSVTIWNVLNAVVLLLAIYELPITDRQRAVVAWLVLNCAITSMLNTQFHCLCVAFIVLSYTFLNKKQEGWAAFFMVLGTMIKLYGIVGLAFFFFAKNKWKYIGGCLAWAIVFFVVPMFFVGIDYTLQCYQDWFNVLTHKNDLNVAINNTRTDVCVMGMFRKILHDGTLSNLYFIVPGLIIFGLSYLKIREFKNINFQMRLLASVVLFIILASTGSESPTIIMAFVGVAIWYILSKKTTLDLALLWFALIISSFSPTDIFPRFIRENYINQYALMALPLLLVWLRLHWQIMKNERS